jgi:uncharacterized DUF497 family protein
MRTSTFFSEGQSEAVHQGPESDPPVETVVYNYRDKSIQAKLILPRTAPLTSHCARYTFCIAMRFEWDREKNRINQQKHGGIAFESAALVFDDPRVILRKDRIVTGEQRWHAIGAVEGAVLLVVHVYRTENENGEEETIRIISAREAHKRERRIYIQQTGE